MEEDKKVGKEGEKEEFESSLQEEPSDSDQSESDIGESADASSNPLCNHAESSSSDALFHKYKRSIIY